MMKLLEIRSATDSFIPEFSPAIMAAVTAAADLGFSFEIPSAEKADDVSLLEKSGRVRKAHPYARPMIYEDK